jgi:hypothetical protein
MPTSLSLNFCFPQRRKREWSLSANRKLNAFHESMEPNGPWILLLYFYERKHKLFLVRGYLCSYSISECLALYGRLDRNLQRRRCLQLIPILTRNICKVTDFLHTTHCPSFISNDVTETATCLRAQVKNSTPVSPIHRASPYVRKCN